MWRKARTVAVATMVCAGAAAAVALADVTRADYVAQVEPICKQNSDANLRILKGAKARAKNGKTKAAAGQFFKAQAALAGTVTQLRAVPQPPDDVSILTSWLGYLDKETTYLGKIAKDLRKDQLNRAQGDALQLKRNADIANDTVINFGFTYCRINPAKFT
jgi:hypothetical protein